MFSLKFLPIVLLVGITCICNSAFSQADENTTASSQFSLFGREEPLKLELSFDIRRFIKRKYKDEYQNASLTVYLDDSTTVSDTIRIKARGEFRKGYCQFPPIKLNFKKADFEIEDLKQLEKVKLVTTCRYQKAFQQYLFQEYLIYKSYNLLSDKSFRVRLVHITYHDSQGKKKTFSQYGFLIEEVDRMAERNACFEIENMGVSGRSCNPYATTLMTTFQYMIGNTDYRINNLHNVKLIRPSDPLKQIVYPVPYDFDYSGMVNTLYAIPHTDLGLESVRDRLYMGYCFTDDVYQQVFNQFQQKKAEIYSLYETYPFFDNRTRRASLSYLNSFYKILDNPLVSKRLIQDNCN
ncbi:MAG: hypothetical protein AAF587_09295 [Bacteroidota bacterium]